VILTRHYVLLLYFSLTLFHLLFLAHSFSLTLFPSLFLTYSFSFFILNSLITSSSFDLSRCFYWFPQFSNNKTKSVKKLSHTILLSLFVFISRYSIISFSLCLSSSISPFQNFFVRHALGCCWHHWLALGAKTFSIMIKIQQPAWLQSVSMYWWHLCWESIVQCVIYAECWN